MIIIKKAIIILFKAIWFLFLILAPSVKLRKKGKFPIVSMVTKNNIKEFMKVAVIAVISYIFMAIIWYREKMNSQYINRIIRACKLDVSLYEEVEADKSATLQAASVVVLSSIAAGYWCHITWSVKLSDGTIIIFS